MREGLKGCEVQEARLNLEAGPAWATSHLLLSLCVSEDIVPALSLTDGGHYVPSFVTGLYHVIQGSVTTLPSPTVLVLQWPWSSEPLVTGNIKRLRICS